MIFWVWLFICNPAQAIDLNDHVRLTLDGGEVVEGYYLRPGANEVVLTRPGVNGTSRIPLAIVDSVELNGDQTPFDVFSNSIKSEWGDWIVWASDPPPHPPPFAVAVARGSFGRSTILRLPPRWLGPCSTTRRMRSHCKRMLPYRTAVRRSRITCHCKN